MPESILLEDLEIYQLALEIGEDVWNIVDKWEYFAKKTVGGQFVEAADSIAANIAEGYGRYFYKDRKQFCYYSRGSMMETKAWAVKSFKRALMSQNEYEALLEKLKVLHHKLNIYIKKLKNTISNTREQL
ncbi:MAG TPA: four helix bundle protein [Chitinophagaceae bacterium]